MLKKLFKYEFYSLFRILLPIYAALGFFTVMCKLSSALEIDNIIYETVSGFSVMFYIFSIIAVFIVCAVIVVTRFYKNLLSNEGYLTLSLPFTPTQHIVCKLLCGVLMIVLSFLAVMLSLLIIALGSEALEDVVKIFSMMFKDYISQMGIFKFVILIFEVCIMAVLAVFQAILMCYAAMAIGQQFKNKIAGSFLSYFGLYFAMEIITSICLTPFMTIFSDNLDNYIYNNGIGTSVMLIFLLPIVFYIIFSTVYLLLTRHFLTNRLNLE